MCSNRNLFPKNAITIILIFQCRNPMSYFFSFFLMVLSFSHQAISENLNREDYVHYLIPSEHVIKPILDAIFSSPIVTNNEQTMKEAGFNRLEFQAHSYIWLAGHPCLPGYLLKLYLQDETRLKNGISGSSWLINRCRGANAIRKIIKRKKIKYFTVPEKYLYALPHEWALRNPLILVVRDMDLVSPDQTLDAWKNHITTQHLDELYLILKEGYGSAFVGTNVPLTKSGLFAFIDMEYPKRKIAYRQVKQFLSNPMSHYWDQLVKP